MDRGGPTFFTQHAIIQYELSELEVILQELAKDSTTIYRKALGGQIQAVSSSCFLQVWQDTLLRLSTALFAQPSIRLSEGIHLCGRHQLHSFPHVDKGLRLMARSKGSSR